MKLESLTKLGAMVAVLGTISCSDPVPPPAQASLYFAIKPSNVPGVGCATGNFVATIGGPPRPQIGDPGPREVDGQNDARIGCRVSGGGSFSLSGSAEKGSTAFNLLGGSISGTSGVGTISVAGPGTAGRHLKSATNACELLVSRPPYQIAPGNVWAQFDCPLITNATDPGSQCGVSGEFVFENCEQ